MKIPKARYQTLFGLYRKQEWLAEREAQLLEMLDLCNSVEEQTLLTELLHNFVYLNGPSFQAALNGLAKLICEDWELDKAKTQLVATTGDYDPDSAQLVLQFLKPLLPGHGWPNPKQNNLFSRSFRDLAAFPTVVLVDEFSGTGNTLVSRINSLKREADLRAKSSKTDIDLKIYVAVIAAIEEVKEVVAPHCERFESQMWLKKGISGRLVGQEKQDAIDHMLRLEGGLKQDFPGVAFPSLGYGQAEALYSLAHSNTPNSVFPIFWWRYLSDGSQRAPLLDRQDPNIP